MLLEFSQYLENYLWPNYDPDKVRHLTEVFLKPVIVLFFRFSFKVIFSTPYVHRCYGE